MQKLKNIITINSTGTQMNTTLVKRDENICMYRRDDEVYEVFKVTQAQPFTKFGLNYPLREKYPSNSDFGLTAWCYPKKALYLAERKYNELIEKSKV